MILRRLTQHVRDQNWFAVVLDFVIVVIGVGVALIAQQWLSERQSQSDYERALEDVRGDLFRLYFASKERLAVADCRKQRYRELGELLMRDTGSWPGSRGEYGANLAESVLPVVLRSPHRIWTSRIWDAELTKGTFDLMDDNDRVLVSSIFATGAEAEAIQANVRDMEASLQALAYPLELTLSDRLRYYDTLARADGAHTLVEVLAAQGITAIETTSLQLVADEGQAAPYREFVTAQNARLDEIYGDCVVPMEFAFLQETNG